MMRRCAFRWFCVAAGLLLLGIPLSGQAGTERTSPESASKERTHLGYTQDWSSRHLLMPGSRVEELTPARAHDPRHVYSSVMRQVALENARILRPRPPRRRRRMKVDWAVSLENGYVPPDQFPAKYQFGIDAEDCNADYVVFGLTVPSGTQANLVGINNLYTEATPPCNSGKPWVAFAYDTVTHARGQIETSPVISEDGTMVAFVESTGTASYFHVLLLPDPIPTPPSQAGTVLIPQTPTTCATPAAPGCMTTLLIENTAGNSQSSPWVDYSTDTAYVGADNGLLYKITPVFGGGAPALVSDPTNWPVTVAALTESNTVLSAPVVDDSSGLIFVGDGAGYLHSVLLSNPATTASAEQGIGWIYDGKNDGSGGPGTDVLSPPIVINDPAHPATNQVFAFTGCSSVPGIGAAVTQLPANFTNDDTQTNGVTVDMGSGTGIGDCTTGRVDAGIVDNAFYLNGTASGHVIACGFRSGTGGAPLIPSYPIMYMFPFDVNGLITGTGDFTFKVDTTVGDECSALTEFYDGTTDRMFFGVGGPKKAFLQSSTIGTSSLTTPNCSVAPTPSCITAPIAVDGTSGIIIDNQLSNGGTNIYFSTLAPGSVNNQMCNVSGGAANPYCAVKLNQAALN